MSDCVTGVCAPIGTPLPDPAAQPPLLPPPADSLPPVSSPPPPDSVQPPVPSPPAPESVQPPVSFPPPPADVLPPASSPPPPPDVLPPVSSPPPPADVLPPASSPPPPPEASPSDPSPTPSSTPLPPPPPPDASPSTPIPPPPPSSSNSSPPPPIVHQSPPKNSTRYPNPPPPVQSSPITVSPSSNSTSPSSGSSSVSMGVIAGAVFGGAAILIILGIFFVCCSKKKRKDEKGAERYYMAPPQSSDGNNGGHMQHWQQSNPPSGEHHYMSNLPPPPGSAFRSPSQRLASRNSSLPPQSYMNGSGNFGGASSDNRGMGLSNSKSSFSYEELAMATNGFSKANFLGQGGFGFVHKGVLPNGKEVAIKSLKADSGQGEREFQAEIDVISRVHHKHLVSLVGYCCTGTQRMLVYEFVQNNTLEFHLFGKGRPNMDWPTRLKIALGAAKGLAYLHEDCHPKIIHRDIKTANILIDLQFEAKVADFGLAKFTEEANTHVSTRVMGTFGYLAPEYASSGKLTDKSDVFSFGVMLLELITGRPPVDRTNSYMEDSLVDWAEPLLAKAMEDGNFEPFVDPKLQNNYNHDEMARMVACAAGATSHSARRRPKMSQIVRALETSASMSDLNDGMGPGQSRVFGENGSPDYTCGQYKEDMKRFRKMVLQSQDTASTEYTTGTTSEYSMYSGSISDSSTTKEMKNGRSP